MYLLFVYLPHVWTWLMALVCFFFLQIGWPWLYWLLYYHSERDCPWKVRPHRCRIFFRSTRVTLFFFPPSLPYPPPSSSFLLSSLPPFPLPSLPSSLPFPPPHLLPPSLTPFLPHFPLLPHLTWQGWTGVQPGFGQPRAKEKKEKVHQLWHSQLCLCEVSLLWAHVTNGKPV